MLSSFQDKNLSKAVAQFFENLQVPLNLVSDAPTTVADILEHHHKTEFNNYTREAYFVGAVNDEAFEGIQRNSLKLNQLRGRKYDFILIFSIEIVRLDENNQPILPTRSQLFDLARAFNRAFPDQPVVLVLRYCETFISIAVCERLPYVRSDKQGDKIGKMSLLRDVNILNTHAGHERILKALTIPRTGKNAVNSFEALYQFWLEKLNVSILNKLFYEELSNWYFWAIQHVQFPNEPTDAEALKTHRANNVIRLITRLIFTWFLKEKKLVSEEIFDLDALQDHIHFNSLTPEVATDSIYYQAILQNLFFATLNQEMTERRFRNESSFQNKNEHFNIKNMYRYADCFKNRQEAMDLFKDIPFLNGGLFECLDDDRLGAQGVVDGFSDNPKRQAKVPTFLFFQQHPMEVNELNEEYGTKGKKYKVRGIISILNDYKFTIAENTPAEQEIALDPELLGRIFENLLASYNPETKSSARKQTGSFYTPREIVNYMVDESLIAYLQNKLQLADNQSLRILFSDTTEQPFTNPKALIEAIDNCKMLDPACGSGAFPMGILHRMVHLLHKLDPHNERWKERQLEKADYIEDATARQDALNAIEKAFEHNELDYGRKLYLIENCIYGVDIQPIAVQIAKLRFFISLLCDQKVDDKEVNRGVLALPNLETKFVAANTLIGLEDANLAKTAVEGLMEQRAKLRRRIFNAKRYADKKRYREQDEKIRAQIKTKLDTLGMGGQTEQLVNWNPFDQNASAPFFDADWMFHVKNGFDIVIGNPPYVEHKKLKEFSTVFKKQFSTYAGTADLYVYFYEHGLRSLNENGNLCFITSNKFIKTEYGKNIRAYFAKNKIRQIIDFTNIHVFDALVASCILIVEKSLPNKQPILLVNTNDDMAKIGLNAFIQKNQILIEQEKLKPELWLLENDSKAALKLWIETNSQTIENTKSIAVYRGVTTGYNPAFIIDDDTRKALIKGDAKNSEIIKPLLQGRNIRKWIYNTTNEYLNFIPWHFPLHEDTSVTGNSLVAETAFKNKYAVMYNYLNDFKTALNNRNKEETGIRYEWYALQRCANTYYSEFEKEKIIWGLTADKWAFAYDDKGHYLPSNGYILTSETIPIKYLLALLNSKVMKYYFGFIGIMTAGGAYTLKHSSIQALPIKIISNTKPFVTLVDYLIFQKQTTGLPVYISNYFEQVIDGMVCELYFEAEMKAKQLNIIELVQLDLATLPDFTAQTHESKIQLIEQLYRKWTAPANAIKNRLVLMPVRSPDLLGVILNEKA